jgi:hypothetical protein
MGGRALPHGVFMLEHRGLLGFGFMGDGRREVPLCEWDRNKVALSWSEGQQGEELNCRIQTRLPS